jgi:hypothetical protein
MEKTIQLPNRNGDKNYLEFLRRGMDWQHLIWYKLNLEHDDLGIRTGYSKLPYIDKNCVFIDPSGGPFMEVDKFKINNLLLKKIVFNKGIKLGFVENK